jgi:hypothetical protein
MRKLDEPIAGGESRRGEGSRRRGEEQEESH